MLACCLSQDMYYNVWSIRRSDSHAENLAESEKARDESIRNKIASRANSDRGKLYPGSAPGFRQNDDFGIFPESGYGGSSRRGYLFFVLFNFVDFIFTG